MLGPAEFIEIERYHSSLYMNYINFKRPRRNVWTHCSKGEGYRQYKQIPGIWIWVFGGKKHIQVKKILAIIYIIPYIHTSKYCKSEKTFGKSYISL